MSKKEDGRHAFPPAVAYSESMGGFYGEPGMTLRQYTAIEMAKALLSQADPADDDQIAAWAVCQADVLLSKLDSSGVEDRS